MNPSLARSVRLALFIIAAIVIYAYGFEVTQVNLDEIQSPERQTRLVRILRALARPDLIEYEKEEFVVTAPIYVPCPEGGFTPETPATGDPYIVITPPCAGPRDTVTIEGFHFAPNSSGPLAFLPPSGVTLNLANFTTDGQGHFEVTARLPNRPAEEAQTVRAITRQNVGAPRFTRNAIETGNKIIETVFLALLATTISTLLAIPLSFFAARNIMKDVTASLMSVGLSLVGWPLGIALGALVARWIGDLSEMFTASTVVSVGGLVAGPVLLWGTARFALPPAESRPPNPGLRLARMAALALGVLAVLLATYLLGDLAVRLGDLMSARLGRLAFLGGFMADLGDILSLLVTPVAGLVGGGVLGGLASSVGQTLSERTKGALWMVLHILLGVAGFATLGWLVGRALEWLYQLGNPNLTLWLPVGLGALAGLLLAVRTIRGQPVAIGLGIYYVARTVFNALRSIEALIMVIVFVVWVGIGPFAGMLALALHSIAAMAKLYSEQVESILPGPLEAIKSTGATRLQTVMYAVLPQVIPPYISFTMYRWDINVRFSTIIGFAGGGGIGFLLQQNINLLLYSAAATQIFAIALVVATMDYLSSRLRERAI